MAINWEVNGSTLVEVASVAFGLLLRIHKWDKRSSEKQSEIDKTNAVRHVENQARLETIERTVGETQRIQQDCNEKITDARERVLVLETLAKAQHQK